MSRNDTHEFEYPAPPGLGYARPTNGYHHNPSASLGSFVPTDRRAAYPQTFAPRSAGMPDHEYAYGGGDGWGAPNRHTPAAGHSQPQTQFNSLSSNHNHRSSAPLPIPPHTGATPSYHPAAPASFNGRESYTFRPVQRSPNSNALATPTVQPAQPSVNTNISNTRSTLWWGELEPWMDEEYAKQVCALMGWDPVNIKVPHPAPDPVTGQQANNPGYCFLTFPSPSHAASVLTQINGSGGGAPVTMPNSSKPLVLNWASSVPNTPLSSGFPPQASAASVAQQQFPKEYSIFVGDLAPETSNSDLVAVFRNPVLGLRNDREPKFIRPFLSCRSAKIMLDPVTGVSRGYGFVRFTEEGDQQRALIEMHGLYCLSRPMRISPATAKFKPPPAASGGDLPQVQFPPMNGAPNEHPSQMTLALPLPNSTQTKSVSAPIAATSSSSVSPPLGPNQGMSASVSGSSMTASNSTPSLSSGASSNTLASCVSSEDMLNLPHNVLAQIAQQYANSSNAGPSSKNGTSPSYHQDEQMGGNHDASAYGVSEESWKHHAQARAILGNLIGPNGEQLTSTDPYNTTVFVGGLSPLISEETLRTFFAPFGDIHYVKVPVGKHCGFVQFVRKADAERAIEKMQGFPVGGSRIRLSWGRSQYKAAQAAAQAAQSAALQTQFPQAPPPPSTSGLSPEQVYQLLHKFGIEGLLSHNTGTNVGEVDNGIMSYPINGASLSEGIPFDAGTYGSARQGSNGSIDVRQHNQPLTSFSPFSPDPNLYLPNSKREESNPGMYARNELLPHPSKNYAPGFGPSSQLLQTQGMQGLQNGGGGSTKVSPTSTRPNSASRYGSFLDSTPSSFQFGRSGSRQDQPQPISRPNSTRGQSQERGRGDEQESIQDLNGTLASLDLDQWKSPALGADNRTMQFRMGAVHRGTPSP